ncbi:MAG: arylsulfatase A-like enzyme, partial [Pseudohongiellaceae bacterium]
WSAATGPAYWDGMLEYDQADIDFLSDLYDGEIAYVDGEIRRLWEYLSEAGLLKSTAVIFLADHGEEFMDHGKYQHDQVYEELLHVPLIVRLPPALERAGYRGRVGQVVELIDVAPTVSELFGLREVPTQWTGRSLVQLLENAGDEGLKNSREFDRPSFSELVIDPGPKYHRTVNWGGWKYIHVWQKDIDHTWEYLFHLEEDPQERRNVVTSDVPETTRALSALRQLLEEQSIANAEAGAAAGPGGAQEIDGDMLELMLKLGYIGAPAQGNR